MNTYILHRCPGTRASDGSAYFNVYPLCVVSWDEERRPEGVYVGAGGIALCVVQRGDWEFDNSEGYNKKGG